MFLASALCLTQTWWLVRSVECVDGWMDEWMGGGCWKEQRKERLKQEEMRWSRAVATKI